MANADKGWLWHRWPAHVGVRNLQDLLKGNHILGLTNVSFEKDRVCSACIAGKQHQSKHPPKNIVSTSRPLELLHVDLFGPPSCDSLGGKKYGLFIVDDYSRYTWVFVGVLGTGVPRFACLRPTTWLTNGLVRPIFANKPLKTLARGQGS